MKIYADNYNRFEDPSLTVNVVLNITTYKGIYLTESGEVGSTTYTDDFITKDELKKLFESDCEKNNSTPVKFMKVKTEKTVYKVDISTMKLFDSPHTTLEEA